MTPTDYPRIPSDRSDDLHHLDIADQADLVLFMAGNQFMAMAEIVGLFRQAYPDVRSIYYETLPPGLELKQILTGGACFGDRVLTMQADVYSSVSEAAMNTLVGSGHIDPDAYYPYLHNRITLMVPEGNPGNIHQVADLGLDHVRISQPDPENEDIAFHIMSMYRDAGGDSLVHRIMEEKRVEGTTIFTIVHHRETPIRIRKRTVDVGPVWATEVVHARSRGWPCDVVDPGETLDQRHHITYYIGRLKNAPNPDNAEKFLDFITSAPAQKLYKTYGFVPVQASSG